MSTEHMLAENPDQETELSLYESSCKFSMDILVEDVCYSIDKLSLEQVKQIAQRMANVISYYDPDYDGVTVDYSKNDIVKINV